MRILFVTDLHGALWKYDRAIECARRQKARVLIHGGDLLPHSADVALGRAFIQEHLDRHFAACARAGIECFTYPGNDDPMALDHLFESVCRRHAGIHNMAQRKIERGGFEFIGAWTSAARDWKLAPSRCTVSSRNTSRG